MKEAYAAAPEGACAGCGAMLIEHPKGRPRKVCSDRCRLDALANVRRSRKSGKKCAACGDDMSMDMSGAAIVCGEPGCLRILGRAAHYGVEVECLVAVLARGVCDICGGDVDLRIDHDHASGAVRGLLCHHCNVGLGFFRDQPERLTRALQYLTEDRRT